jgi:putative methionine-R-sulfoxide reductase with GAF domain
MQGSAQPEDRFPSTSVAGDGSNGNRTLAETELDSALQLLVERAQYITGATGSALALPQGEEMVCRASAGASAPAVGARLQVRSGLTGESILRRQLLRCDNAESDPRVNLETCRALGIASIVVLPLLRRSGEVRGLFELFSDHPYAFEERDLIALERMADLTLTALDLAEQRQTSIFVPPVRQEAEKPVEATTVIPLHSIEATIVLPEIVKPQIFEPKIQPKIEPEIADLKVAEAAAPPVEAVVTSSIAPASVPEAMRRVQKCASCGFPVSEGRELCLDCEKKDGQAKKEWEGIERAEQAVQQTMAQQSETQKVELQTIVPDGQKQEAAAESSTSESSTNVEGEFVPAFLANAEPASESWFANQVNLLAIVVLILGILVAVVVFR